MRSVDILEGMSGVIKNNPQIPRRTLFKWFRNGAVDALIVGAVAGTMGCISPDQQVILPDNLLEAKPLSPLLEPSPQWQKIYYSQGEATISSLARKFYLDDFNNNQGFYTNKVRYANRQTPAKNALVYAKEGFYIPDPRVPTLGFTAGEETILKGEKIKGQYFPTGVQKIDISNNEMEVYYYNGSLRIPLTIGHVFATSRRIKLAAVLKGTSGLVPPRVVFELLS